MSRLDLVDEVKGIEHDGIAVGNPVLGILSPAGNLRGEVGVWLPCGVASVLALRLQESLHCGIKLLKSGRRWVNKGVLCNDGVGSLVVDEGGVPKHLPVGDLRGLDVVAEPSSGIVSFLRRCGDVREEEVWGELHGFAIVDGLAVFLVFGHRYNS